MKSGWSQKLSLGPSWIGSHFSTDSHDSQLLCSREWRESNPIASDGTVDEHKQQGLIPSHLSPSGSLSLSGKESMSNFSVARACRSANGMCNRADARQEHTFIPFIS